jgi:hypothetical protein
MSTEAFAPSIDIIEDFRSMNLTITEDSLGEKTRKLVVYFENAALKSKELYIQSSDTEEKAFSSMLNEAFVAAHSIVLDAWEKAHGSALAR